jgi:hypothetical protein
MWTEFYDMHSGGGSKERWEMIYIEAPEDEAKVIFYNKFGHSPERITCTCCGNDYAINQSDTIEEATEYHRGRDKLSVDQYEALDYVLMIRKEDIKDEWRGGQAPSQGYVWVD